MTWENIGHQIDSVLAAMRGLALDTGEMPEAKDVAVVTGVDHGIANIYASELRRAMELSANVRVDMMDQLEFMQERVKAALEAIAEQDESAADAAKAILSVVEEAQTPEVPAPDFVQGPTDAPPHTGGLLA